MVLVVSGLATKPAKREKKAKSQKRSGANRVLGQFGPLARVFVAQSGQAGKILSATHLEDLPLAGVFTVYFDVTVPVL
jgi:hypothetical protein